MGVLKPGHRCARIDDLASDVYSAIEYIYVEKGSSITSLRAGKHALTQTNRKSVIMLLSMHTRVYFRVDTHTHARKHYSIHSCAHMLTRSWAHALAI